MEVLVINGHDYTKYVKAKGYGWSREDLDSEKTKRPKSGTLRRDKITTKRKLSYTLLNAPHKVLEQLDDDLNQASYTATYLDLHGKMTRRFYSSSFSAILTEICDGDEEGEWEGAEFNMIEV